VNIAKPSRHLSKKSSSFAMTSSKKMFGDFPPSSNVIGIKFCDAYCIIKRPVVVSPVKAIFLILFDDANGLPASKPKPLTTLTTPGGNKSPISSISNMIDAGVWTRNGNIAYRMGREIQAGRVWTNCYHAYPAHAAFGGYKQSGIGRETHKMMLNHYRQVKNLHVSYSEKKLGFF
jgi:hypothetical protein